MIFKSRSSRFGTLIAVASLAASGFSSVSAETVMTVNGVDVDTTVFDAYLESRFQKPAVQASPDERATVERELTDIYLLTTQPKAKEFSEDPQIKAQIELQYRGTIAQAVARAAHRVQERVVELAINFRAQSRDVYVDDVRLRVEVISPHVLEQHSPGHHLQEVARK